MAKRKRGGFGKFIGNLGGNPYDRLMSQFERTVKQAGDDDDELADQLDRFARIVKRRYEEGEIDDEEHDLLIEEVEDTHKHLEYRQLDRPQRVDSALEESKTAGSDGGDGAPCKVSY